MRESSPLHRNLVAAAVFDKLLTVMADNLDPDAVLMLRVREGDAAAFEALVEKYKQPVLNVLYRTLQDATEAEDLGVQPGQQGTVGAVERKRAEQVHETPGAAEEPGAAPAETDRWPGFYP